MYEEMRSVFGLMMAEAVRNGQERAESRKGESEQLVRLAIETSAEVMRHVEP